MLEYSSKDFGKTKKEPDLKLPDRLIHKNVEDIALDSKFSQERKHPVFVVDLPSKTISMTIGYLERDQITSKHRHTYETILYVLEGKGRTFVEGKAVDWKAGDAVYIPNWAWHYHENMGSVRARYVACENAPLLQNIAGVALREEAE